MRADPSYYPSAHGDVSTVNIYGLPVDGAHQLDARLIDRLNRQVATRTDINGHFMQGNPITLWFVPDNARQWPEFVSALHQVLMTHFPPQALEYRTYANDWRVREPDGTDWLMYCARTRSHHTRPPDADKLAS